tara:strand:+ start:584 stop:886 length:303 start_codon:yes stop_codon:yes gene_type:complete
MDRTKILELFNNGMITGDQRDELLHDLSIRETALAEANEAQDWLKKVKAAPLHVKTRMVKEQSVNLAIEAAGMDGWEAKEKQKKSYNFSRSLRGNGGFSF